MFLCTPFANRCLVYSQWALYHLAQLISQTRRDSPCAYSSHRRFGIHLITAVSEMKRLILHEFTLWGRDLGSVIRIRKSPYYKGFLQKIYENFVGDWKLSVILERCPYTERFYCISFLHRFFFLIVLFYFKNVY